jgi:hypothetical protein
MSCTVQHQGHCHFQPSTVSPTCSNRRRAWSDIAANGRFGTCLAYSDQKYIPLKLQQVYEGNEAKSSAVVIKEAVCTILLQGTDWQPRHMHQPVVEYHMRSTFPSSCQCLRCDNIGRLEQTGCSDYKCPATELHLPC